MTHPIIADPRPWAFTRPALTAGLRAYTNDPTLVLTDLYEMTIPFRHPAVGRIRGLNAVCTSAEGKKFFRLAVKEPHGATRAGTAGAGLREASFYRNLAEQLPLRVPHLFASHPEGNWLILEMLPLERKPETWTPDNYRQAIGQLVALHDRFWGLGADLAAYPWLARPLGSDRAIYAQAAAAGLQKLVDQAETNPLAQDPELIATVQRLVNNIDQVASALRAAPDTLLHGDFWPGNITQGVDDEIYIYDWQQASIGPGVLDLFHFVQTSQWYLAPLPISPAELVAQYRAQLFQAAHFSWTDADWEAQWDYALLWNFMTDWVDMLVNIPAAVLQTRYQQMRSLWIDPVMAAIQRRLPGA